jgi:hypothetical protein
MPCSMIATPDRLNFGSMAEPGVEAIWIGEGYRTFRLRLTSRRDLHIVLGLLRNVLSP